MVSKGGLVKADIELPLSDQEAQDIEDVLDYPALGPTTKPNLQKRLKVVYERLKTLRRSKLRSNIEQCS